MLLDQVVLNIHTHIYIYNICELWYKLLFVVCHCVIVNDVQPEPCCGINPGQHHDQSRMHIQWNHRMFVNKSWCKPNSKPFTKKHISVNMCKHCFQTVSKKKKQTWCFWNTLYPTVDYNMLSSWILHITTPCCFFYPHSGLTGTMVGSQ